MDAEDSPLPAEWFTDTPPRPPLPWSARRARLRAIVRNPRVWLWGYVLALAAVALWPVPVDRGAGRLLAAVTRFFPILTYERIEFLANIAMFVPLGILLMLILAERWLVMPIAFTVTVLIEGTQALLLAERTPSLYDIVANLAGACIGVLCVAFVQRRRTAARVRSSG